MINIPKNEYVQPSEVREEVVQAICEAFLSTNCWTTYHPFSQSAYRRATRFILKKKNETRAYGFNDETFNGEEGIRFNGAEMKRAFEVLIEAGYYMFKVYSYGTWLGYKCGRRPFMDGGKRVESFDDRID